MKKYFVLLLALVILLPSVMAIDLDVNKLSSDEAMILELDDPAVFSLNITNNGPTDNFRIYTYFGSGQEPGQFETFTIKNNETKALDFKVYPQEGSTETGSVIFDYYIIDSSKEKYAGRLNVQRIPLKDAFDIGSENIHPERNSVSIYIENNVNVDFGEINAKFKSPFFEIDRSFSLGPKERLTFEKELNKEQFDKVKAGFYTLQADLNAKGISTTVQGIIQFEQQKNIDTEKEKYGFLVRTERIIKSNTGNVEENVEVRAERGTISRLFTSLEPYPDNIDRQGSKVYYIWNRDLGPGEELDVKVKTNWIFPLLFVILLVIAVALIKRYNEKDLKIVKKTKFVKSKGNEFALRVDLFVESKKHINNVVIIEKLPPLLKLYKKFGREKPSKVDDKSKRMEWEFRGLEPGEKRVISYVAYSKVKVVGKFALPKAKALYEKEDKVKETTSNRTYFVSEQSSKK